MGVFLIFAIIAVICIIAIVFVGIMGKVYNKSYEKNKDNRFAYHFYSNDGSYYMIFGCALVACALAIIVCLGVIICTVCERQVKYQQYELQYQVISAKLKDNEGNYYLLASEINEYNNAILEDKYWADNLWVNWYHNGLIKDLPLIGEEKGV